MDVGALVWVQDPADGMAWTAAQITSVHQRASPSVDAVTVELQASGRQLDITLPPGECRNVLLQNQPEEADPSDLVALPHLHEASILHALRLRYARDAIYTRIGEILISVNPFKGLPALYTRDTVDAYAPTVDGGATAAPHLFAIARAAYVDVVRNGCDQSILISGESGAGKTEATKIMMKYFAETCGTSASAADGHPTIEAQVLHSNPILEAFGNARTVRNDNSSRFGKFIELQFDTGPRHAIVGARIRTYLLEKIRVISQSPNERNFHVFYELIAAAAKTANPIITAAAPAWRLGSATEFRILSQSGCLTRRDGVDDATQFERTLRAMQQIGLRDDEVVHVLSVVAALLHLGNVTFSRRQSAAGDQEAIITAGHAAFMTAAALLRVDPDRLAFALTKRTLTTATESLTVAMDVPQAEHTRNALVMECYRLLFAWLVDKINRQIHHEAVGKPSIAVQCIGLLDIFGFEDMAVNSFEQLCINYANEALQHQFNEFVFAQEQRLYQDEGIAWAFIDFPNNSACLELFERKPIGLFSLADQECLFPQGSDRALLAKLYAEFDKKEKHPHFAPPPAGWQRQSHFVVAHYAGKVSYAVDGFLAKNKDAFCETAAALLATSATPLVHSLSTTYTAKTASATTTSATAKHKSTLAAVSVGTQFKLQLVDLLDRIRATAPHYVRCIKPNDCNVRDSFHAPRVLEQLRSGGVLEAVRVARAGFPVRMTHRQFAERYERVLLFSSFSATTKAKSTPPTTLDLLARLHTLVPSAPLDVSLGKTKVFFRRAAYEQLEQLRVCTSHAAATVLQKTLRGYVVHRRYLLLRKAVLRLQAQLRGCTARRHVLWLRRNSSATILQTTVRRWLAQRRYRRFLHAVVTCQTHARRCWATAVVQTMREAQAATAIAAFYRCHATRRRYAATKRLALALQCFIRRSQAKKTLRILRLESRNVSKLQQDNLQLQAELAVLRLQLLNMQTSVIKPSTLPPLQASPVLVKIVDHLYDSEGGNQRLELLDAEAMKALQEEAQRRPQLVVAMAATAKPVPAPPASVCPPSAPGRRGSFSSLSTVASTTKAELFVQNRSRSTTSGWKQQQHAHLDMKVKQLREELKTAAAAANPEEEQDEIVKRFVTTQIRAESVQLHHRHSGSFGLELSEDCDNNSAADGQDTEPTDAGEDDAGEEATVPPAQVQSKLRPPMTACAPHRRFAWSSTPGSSTLDAPLSARLPSSSSSTSSSVATVYRPRFFGDDGLNASSVTRSSAFSSSSAFSRTGSSLVPPGSVPRWCKDSSCKACACPFTFLIRRHHCRSCGNSFCYEHSTRRMLLPELGYMDVQRVCDDCFELRLRESHASFGSGRLAEVYPVELTRASSLAVLTRTGRLE